jgi:hypothetical protein
MYGLTRGLMTLVGAAAAGGMIWFASGIGPSDSIADYWLAMGLVAGAGLVMALSQLLGGWTKWGLPTVSGSVLGLGFLPALIAGGWMVVAAQPNADQARDRVLGWSADIGISGIVSDLTTLVGAIAFAVGLAFGFVFDTTGGRRRADVVEHDRYAADEPVGAERGRRPVRTTEPAYDGDTRTREPVGVGSRTRDDDTVVRDERATPAAPQPESESETRPRRRSFFRRS